MSAYNALHKKRNHLQISLARYLFDLYGYIERTFSFSPITILMTILALLLCWRFVYVSLWNQSYCASFKRGDSLNPALAYLSILFFIDLVLRISLIFKHKFLSISLNDLSMDTLKGILTIGLMYINSDYLYLSENPE